MKLRRMTVAAALGATVLTTVPTFIAPYTAYASCVENNSSCGNDDQPPGEDPIELPDDPSDPSDPGVPSDPGDPGDNGDQGPVDATLPTVVTDGTNVSEAPEPAPADATLPTVVVDGVSTPVPAPADPGMPSYDWTEASGGGSAAGAILYSPGTPWEKPENCYRNQLTSEVKYNQTVKYDVSYQVSGNISAKAGEVLSVQLGAQLNTTISRSTGIDVTLQPGQSWTIYVEYQTNLYKVTSFDWLTLSYRTEYVNVTVPTGNVTVRSC
ncbi:DUF6426 family protein [Streptomyces muensis]|uniref:Uncharacterized protein n=1 Tax=Streptomyces muensis TaxID=1077944 RepID=A0A9X1PUQ5_STRM4|nr:DUF6426 family protein [Streptomyces muensis]MCF1592894.1 hypothetical protein [Streptomyces muensis]